MSCLFGANTRKARVVYAAKVCVKHELARNFQQEGGMQGMLEEKWLQERLEMVEKVKYELRKAVQEGRIKDKQLQKLLLKALQIVHMYEVELEDRLDELSTTGGYSEIPRSPLPKGNGGRSTNQKSRLALFLRALLYSFQSLWRWVVKVLLPQFVRP
jgi:hypothetical protein